MFIFSQTHLCLIHVHWLVLFHMFAILPPSSNFMQILALKCLSSHVLINMGGGSYVTLERYLLYPRPFSVLQSNKPNKWKVKQKLLQLFHRSFSNISQGKGLSFPVPHPFPVLSAYNLTFFINLSRLSSSSVIHTFSSEQSLSHFLSENIQNLTIYTAV